MRKQKGGQGGACVSMKGNRGCHVGCPLLGTEEEGGTLTVSQTRKPPDGRRAGSCGGRPGRPPASPCCLMASRLLGWLLVPWTLQLAGTVRVSVCTLLLGNIRAAFIQPEQLIPGDLSLGICWLLFEHCRLHRGSLRGPGRCLANASPRWLLKGWGTALSPWLLC